MSATIALPAVIDGIDGVHLPQMPPFTTLLLRTMNSLYRVVIRSGPQVLVEGGAHFPTLTAASLDGVSRSGRCFTGGWIGVGVLLEIRTQDQWIVTTPVLAMAAEPSTSPTVH